MPVHFGRSLRSGFGKRGKIRLVDGGEDDKVALSHLHGVVDDFGSGGSFRKIGDPNDQAAAALLREQNARGERVIGFGSFRANLREAVDDGAKVERAARGDDVLLNRTAIREQADTVAALRSNLSEGKGGVDGVVQF